MNTKNYNILIVYLNSSEDCGVLTHETDDLKQEPNAVRGEQKLCI